MSRSIWVAGPDAGMVVELVFVGAGAAWDARRCWNVFRGDLR